MTLSDLPLHMQNNILYKFSDASDIINLGQATPTLRMLSEDRHLWKKLCQFHFAEKQVGITVSPHFTWIQHSCRVKAIFSGNSLMYGPLMFLYAKAIQEYYRYHFKDAVVCGLQVKK